MGETLHDAGELNAHLQLQTQIAGSTADQTVEGFIPQQRQVSEKIMAIGRASRAKFMRPQLEAEAKAQKFAEIALQREERRAFVAESLENGDAEWDVFAKCKGSDADFFPEGITEPVLKRVARAACSGCFVKNECLQDELAQGVKNQYGIRGGTTPRERRAMLNAQLDAAS